MTIQEWMKKNMVQKYTDGNGTSCLSLYLASTVTCTYKQPEEQTKEDVCNLLLSLRKLVEKSIDEVQAL